MEGRSSRVSVFDSLHIEEAFASISHKYFGYQVVLMPPTWREQDPVLFTFVLFTEELSQQELLRFFELSAYLEIPNPRPISSQLLELASLFHPLFYASFTSGCGRLRAEGALGSFLDQLGGCSLVVEPKPLLGVATVRYYLQSLLFLAGCTLSAAIIQDRFSDGTIQSKLNRLWQASQYAKRFGYEAFNALQMEDFIRACDSDVSSCEYMRLMAIKKNYGDALSSLVDDVVSENHVVQQENLSGEDKIRFGFIGHLRDILATNLQCVIVYGSTVTSQSFSDYDLIVVVHDAEQAFEVLAGSNPVYNGREINLSIYNPRDFLVFQAASGDNLDHNARCIYGEAETVIKPQADLIVRNFSFGFVRLRQLLGMAGYLAQQRVHGGLQNQINLYEYFVKIPMHIMKGVRSAAHEPVAKEYINAWTSRELGYDIATQMELVKTGHVSEAIANAYFATQGVLTYLNECYGVFKVVPKQDADIWHHLESVRGRHHIPGEFFDEDPAMAP
jgi:hypothetical protein